MHAGQVKKAFNLIPYFFLTKETKRKHRENYIHFNKEKVVNEEYLRLAAEVMT